MASPLEIHNPECAGMTLATRWVHFLGTRFSTARVFSIAARIRGLNELLGFYCSALLAKQRESPLQS